MSAWSRRAQVRRRGRNRGARRRGRLDALPVRTVPHTLGIRAADANHDLVRVPGRPVIRRGAELFFKAAFAFGQASGRQAIAPRCTVDRPDEVGLDEGVQILLEMRRGAQEGYQVGRGGRVVEAVGVEPVEQRQEVVTPADSVEYVVNLCGHLCCHFV